MEGDYVPEDLVRTKCYLTMGGSECTSETFVVVREKLSEVRPRAIAAAVSKYLPMTIPEVHSACMYSHIYTHIHVLPYIHSHTCV
jgi:hypothetical protein